MISGGYRLSPKHKYPAQVKDVCACYNAAIKHLEKKCIDTSKVVVVGPSAGAHLTSIMCYCEKVQKLCHVDISNIIGYIGFGGPYSFRDDQTKTLSILLSQLFKKGYNRRKGEPVTLMTKNHIPMLLIQSRHDGVIEYGCAEDFAEKAKKVGNECEIYTVEDKKNTHSWYTAGLFLETRKENKGLEMFFKWIESRQNIESMKLREYNLEKDFDTIKNWISDERTHALWCANRAKKCYESVGFRERHTDPDAFHYLNESWGRCNMVIENKQCIDQFDNPWKEISLDDYENHSYVCK